VARSRRWLRVRRIRRRSRGSKTITQGDIDDGSHFNLATVTGTDTNDEPVTDVATETVPLEQNPSIDLIKTFADDSAVAGGDPSSSTLIRRLKRRMVLVESNDKPTVPNEATVAAEAPQGNPDDSGDDITAIDDDTIDILVVINLLIEKAFVPDEVQVPQGTPQIFAITVTNEGLSDVVDAVVTDDVSGFLALQGDPIVTAVGMGTGSGTCTVTDPVPTNIGPQEVNCDVDIPAGESVLITASYLAAPFLSGDQVYGDGLGDGAEFQFIFDNGNVLEGNALGPVYLDRALQDLSGQSLTKNDFFFYPPGGESAFLLHLSCSDPFTDGWGQSDGPYEGINSQEWGCRLLLNRPVQAGW
jgi:hypothetical protein